MLACIKLLTGTQEMLPVQHNIEQYGNIFMSTTGQK
jgi:hypothetical protein